MEFKVVSYIVIGIVLGSALGAGGGFFYFTPQINTLQSELKTEQANYDALLAEKTALYTNFENLQTVNQNLETSNHNLETSNQKLQNEKTALQASYNSLQSNYNNLQAEKNTVSNYLSNLSDDILAINDELNTLAFFEDSLKRTLNNAELDKIGSTVNSITTSSMDSWDGRDAIYNYIVNNIEYNYDTEFLYLSGLRSNIINGKNTYTSADITLFRNFIQTPEYTVTNQRGDCEDQAILEYAMIMYFYRHIYGTTYRTYLADISFASGPGHITVFVPVIDGRLCILDTAGHYRTSSWGSTTSRDATTELNQYDDYWSSNGQPPITNIKLYRIDTTTGKFTIDIDGSLSTVAQYLTTH